MAAGKMVEKITKDFYSKIQLSEPFSESAEKLACIFVRTEESVEPGVLLKSLLESAPTPKFLEHILYSFLDVRESDFDIIHYSIKYKKLKKLFLKIQSLSPDLSSEAYHTYNTINIACKISSFEEIAIASTVSRCWLNKLQNGISLSERENIQLSLLIKGEAAALKMQSDYISTNADAYNMRKMMTLLPLISMTDELSQRLIETAEKLASGNTIGEPVLSFEYALKAEQYQKWLKKISQENSLKPFTDLLSLQRSKMIPQIRLAVVTSIVRYISGNKGELFQWIASAVDKSTKNGFQIELGNLVHRVRMVLKDQGIIFHESSIYGNFNSISLNHLIGPDKLSIDFDSKKDFSIQELVVMGMRNEALMCRLLDNPKIYNLPRLVEYVAKTSRSILVLSKIAQNRELHSGLINNGVPLSLIKNPTHLPLNMLRQFINTRYISLNEMKFLIKTPYGLRTDIYNEIKNFLDRKR